MDPRTKLEKCGDTHALGHRCGRKRGHPGLHVAADKELNVEAVWGMGGSETDPRRTQRTPTLRDQFAMAAAQGLLAACGGSNGSWCYDNDFTAKAAYDMADALLTHRETRAPQPAGDGGAKELEEALRVESRLREQDAREHAADVQHRLREEMRLTTRIRELEEALRGLMLSRDAAWKGGHDWDEAVDRAARVLAEVQP